MLEPVAADALHGEQLDSPASRTENRVLNGTEVSAKTGDLGVPVLTFPHQKAVIETERLHGGDMRRRGGGEHRNPERHGFHHPVRVLGQIPFIVLDRKQQQIERGERSVDAFQVEFDIASAGDRLDRLGHLDGTKIDQAGRGAEPADALEFGFPPAHQLSRLDVDGILQHVHVVMKIPCVNAEIFASDGHHIGGVHESDNLLPHPVTLGTLQQKMIVEIVDHQRPCFPHCAKRSKRSDLLTDIDVALRAFIHRHAVAVRLQKPTEPPRPQSRACGRDIAECVKSEAQDS